MRLKRVTIEEETNLRPEFSLETTGRNEFCYTLFAKFLGQYRPGSAGSPDAHFILGMTKIAVGIWHPSGVVLDLSELTYEWGDEMDWLLPPTVGRPAAVVVGPNCAPAIATLLWGLNTQKQATEAEHIFDNLDAAWEHVRYRG